VDLSPRQIRVLKMTIRSVSKGTSVPRKPIGFDFGKMPLWLVSEDRVPARADRDREWMQLTFGIFDEGWK
jgi:hypothetical protein